MSDIVIILSGDRAQLDTASSGFAHGFGLFETMRLSDRQLYFWEPHWARLSASARKFDLELPNREEVLEGLKTLVAGSGLQSATLKLSLVKEVSGSRLYLYARPAMAVPGGCRLRLDFSAPIHPQSLLAGHKTHNYMESIHLLARARSEGFYDVLRLDSRGNLAETTTANFFFIKEGRICTPSLDTGVLPGVSRAALLGSPEFEIEEACYPPEALLGAEAAFVSNATLGLQKVESIQGFEGGESLVFAADSPCFRALCTEFKRIQAASALKLF